MLTKSGQAKAQQAKGSPYYMAPELLLGEGASRKSDVYAYGIILHFLVTLNRVPFEGAEDMEVRCCAFLVSLFHLSRAGQ